MGPNRSAPSTQHTPPRPPGDVSKFGVFEVDRGSAELRKSGMRIRLAGQPAQILLMLLERPGSIVTREELRQRLWSSDTFVDFDVSLSSAVRKLREALGDSADNPQFIETVPRQGYRFIAPLRDSEPEDIEKNPPPRSRRVLAWVAALIVLAAIGGVIAMMRIPTPARGAVIAKPAGVKSIAILPFQNLTGDPSQEYFADAMTDLLTTSLAQSDGILVISRTSASRYKKTAKPLRAIGTELGVDALVEGSVSRANDRLLISVQLIDAREDRHLWAHTFEGVQSDVPALQSAIASDLAEVLALPGRRGEPRRAAGAVAISQRAYDAYLKGVALTGIGTAEANRNAVRYFEQAVAEQPDFAAAYAFLARTQWQLIYAGSVAPREVVPKVETAVRRAIALDDSLAMAHRTLGTLLQNYYWKWEDGDRELKRAWALDRNSVEAHTAAAHALVREGRYAEAASESERVRLLDPLSVDAVLSIAAALRTAGEYERALPEFRKAVEINPNVARAHFQLGVTLLFMNRLDDAIAEIETAMKVNPNSRFKAYLGYVYAKAGRAADARRVLRELETESRAHYVSSFGLALIHDVLGEREAAMAALEKAREDHAIELAQTNQYPRFRSLQSDPRFLALMDRVARPSKL